MIEPMGFTIHAAILAAVLLVETVLLLLWPHRENEAVKNYVNAASHFFLVGVVLGVIILSIIFIPFFDAEFRGVNEIESRKVTVQAMGGLAGFILAYFFWRRRRRQPCSN